MRNPAWVCTIDETRASAAFGAALLGLVPNADTPAIELVGDRKAALTRLLEACARRGLSVEPHSDALVLGDRKIALSSDATTTTRARLREDRVELDRSGTFDGGERAELLAASALFEAFERGGGLRWALLHFVEGRDEWSASVDMRERRAEARLDASLSRWFPSLVGRVSQSSAVSPQLGASLQLCVVLGAGATVEGVRDLLAAQTDDLRSRWPRLRSRPGFGSADCLGDSGLSLDLDAITSVGPMVRIVGYFDPPALLAGDLLRRVAASTQHPKPTKKKQP